MIVQYNADLCIDEITESTGNFDSWLKKPILDFFKYLLSNAAKAGAEGIYWLATGTTQIDAVKKEVQSRKQAGFITCGIPVLNKEFLGYCFPYNPAYNIQSEQYFIHTWRISADSGYLSPELLANTVLDTQRIESLPQLLQLIAYHAFNSGYIVLQKLDTGSKKFPCSEAGIPGTLIAAKWIYVAAIAAACSLDTAAFKLLFAKKNFIRATIKNKFTDQFSDYPDIAACTYDVVIPTIGRGKVMHDVLDHLAAQDLLPQNVIIIQQVHPGVLDDYDYLKTASYPFRIIHQVITRLGACNARNLAIAELKSDYVFFADDDIVFEKGVIKNGIVQLHHYGADVLTIATYLSGQKTENRVVKGWEQFGTMSSVVKREFIKGNRFDLGLEMGWGEDTDFGLSLRREGAVMFYSSYDRILHLKAPMGGFRSKVPKPWEKGIPAKPSPTMLYLHLKNYTVNQVRSYKLIYMTKRFVTAPLKEKLMIPFYWNKSIKFARDLLKNRDTINQ